MKAYAFFAMTAAIAFISALSAETPGPAAAAVFDDEVAPALNDNFSHAAFRLWLDSARRKDGILVVVPGWNSDGRDSANDPAMQGFAAKHNLALVACYWMSREGSDLN